jgi:4-hydroxybenzoate polyprenyltransferase
MFFPLVTKTVGNYPASLPVWILGTYAYFAFMLTWMREIVKDMEDFKGDEAEGCITMPIKKGLEYSRHFTTALSLLVIVPMCVASFVLYRHNYGSMSLYVAFLVALLAGWTIFLHSRHTTRHYHMASSSLKIIMLFGICSFIIYYLQLYPNSAA